MNPVKPQKNPKIIKKNKYFCRLKNVLKRLFGANAMYKTGFEEQIVTSEESVTYLEQSATYLEQSATYL